MLYSTERLNVRKWQKKDAADLFEYVSLNEVTKFLSFPTYTSLDQAHERIDSLLEKYTQEEISGLDFAIELKTEKKVIGSIGLVAYSKKAGGIIEIGYVLNPKFQHKGYMTEALIGMFKYIKANQMAKRIELKHDVENAASGNVMKRAGMTFEGILRKKSQNNTNKRADIAIYSILEEEI